MGGWVGVTCMDVCSHALPVLGILSGNVCTYGCRKISVLNRNRIKCAACAMIFAKWRTHLDFCLLRWLDRRKESIQ